MKRRVPHILCLLCGYPYRYGGTFSAHSHPRFCADCVENHHDSIDVLWNWINNWRRLIDFEVPER